MPHLQVFAMCQSGITDRETFNLSIINILGAVEVQPFSPEPIPQNASTALSWSAACLWLRLPEDEGKHWIQKLDIVRPDGTNVGEGFESPSFVMEHMFHSLIMKSDSFPIGLAGEYKINLSYKEAETANEWVQVGSHPFLVKHGIYLNSPSALP